MAHADAKPKFFRPVSGNKFVYLGPPWAELSIEGRTERLKEAVALNISYPQFSVLLKVPGQNNGRNAVCSHAFRHLKEDERPAPRTLAVRNGRKGPKSTKSLPRGHASVKQVESVQVKPIEFDFSDDSLFEHLLKAPRHNDKPGEIDPP